MTTQTRHGDSLFMRDELTEEQLYWLGLLMKHRPEDGADPPEMPHDVRTALLDRGFAHLRHGIELEITFDGIREVLRPRNATREAASAGPGLH